MFDCDDERTRLVHEQAACRRSIGFRMSRDEREIHSVASSRITDQEMMPKQIAYSRTRALRDLSLAITMSTVLHRRSCAMTLRSAKRPCAVSVRGLS